ncbi:carbohydrate ABC transporter permease [Spirochaeta thermophila]|uniref:Transporter n=1 Tax=Winmispira thermophila (strain ATCC 49972 / DSM 6192 / RI 19.B1) TaxID=665571 RepID=E0RPT7_WINT6|nr:carbohydrate ABC transporter permease [Spirochaeta thermophila]ADN01401.1 transporter [Spirochaeta thermophila DSM 6192]
MTLVQRFNRANLPRTVFVIVNTLFLLFIVMLIVIPLLKVFVDSVDARAAETIFRFLPEKFTLDAYRNLLSRPALYRPFLVSLYTTTLGTIIALMTTALFAYALAQDNLPGKGFFLMVALITMVFRAGMIPLFLVVRDIGLLNNVWAVILSRCVDAYYLLLLRNFFKTIPTSIMEAAEIDGCKPFTVFWRIVLPLSKPGLAAIGLFYLVMYWSQFFEYILFLPTKPQWHNFQVFLRNVVIESETQGFEGFAFATQSLKNAVVVASMIPVLIAYPFVQKYFVKGINIGAVKG